MKKVAKNKTFCFFLLLLWMLCITALPASAREAQASLGQLSEPLDEVVEALPPEVEERLPEHLEDGAALEESLTELTSPKYLLSVALELFGISLGETWKRMAVILAFLLICALLREVGSSLGSEGLTGVLRFCSVGGLFLTLSGTLLSQLSAVSLYFERLVGMMKVMIPVTGTVWAMGGNVSTASAGTATLYSFLAVCEGLCAGSLFPIVGISTALILCNLALPDFGTGQFLAAIRKLYTIGTGFLMTLLIAALSAQTTVGTAVDSTGAKAAKFLSATVIPVVGGSVGDTLRSVASGVEYVKSVVGVSGIVFVLLLVLPTLIHLLVTRLALLLGSGAADLLGCERESKLLSELGVVYGTVIAVVAMSAVMFVLSFAVFLRTAVAIA